MLTPAADITCKNFSAQCVKSVTNRYSPRSFDRGLSCSIVADKAFRWDIFYRGRQKGERPHVCPWFYI